MFQSRPSLRRHTLSRCWRPASAGRPSLRTGFLWRSTACLWLWAGARLLEEGTKAKSILISAYCIAKCHKWRLLDNNSLFSNLTDVIMKSKRALPVLLMHDGSLHLNSLIVRFILLYIHSSQNHLHFHACFSSEEFRLMSKYHFQIKPPQSSLTCSGRQWAPSTTGSGCLHRCVWRTQRSPWTGSAQKPAKDEPPGEISSRRRSWLSGWAAASHTGRTGYCLVPVAVSHRWLVGWLELAGKQKRLRSMHACTSARVCTCVYECVCVLPPAHFLILQ